MLRSGARSRGSRCQEGRGRRCWVPRSALQRLPGYPVRKLPRAEGARRRRRLPGARGPGRRQRVPGSSDPRCEGSLDPRCGGSPGPLCKGCQEKAPDPRVPSAEGPGEGARSPDPRCRGFPGCRCRGCQEKAPGPPCGGSPQVLGADGPGRRHRVPGSPVQRVSRRRRRVPRAPVQRGPGEGARFPVRRLPGEAAVENGDGRAPSALRGGSAAAVSFPGPGTLRLLPRAPGTCRGHPLSLPRQR